ncbi:hypothetical protein JZK55_11170 [Dissulfurispira thermophila]|uniref:histidine kinase n=2 Tax=root TaxID=1 RepID=A0A7G1H084_9BACT|nr:ATP-binding protein [Dissulfurispira thermophila]BCB96195.1 hypothetical protein JZK55_11170 [Dissulfurispira thermophila]
MNFSEKTKITLPILLIAIFVFSSFGWIFYFHNYQLKQITRTVYLLNTIDRDIKEFNMAVQSGILTLDNKYVIHADKHSLSVFDSLSTLRKSHSLEAERIKRKYMEYYSKLVSINSLFLEKRIAEGRKRLGELELIYSEINDEISKAIAMHTLEHERAVKNINIFMAVTSFVFIVMVSLIIALFMHYSKKRKQAEKAMIESEKMASLGVLAAGIAHEIRNPLTIISLGIEHLKQMFAGDKDVLYLTGNIHNAVERADKIIKGLLDYSQQSAFRFEDFDVSLIIEESLQILDEQIKNRNISVVKQFSPLPLHLKCDRDKMRQVFVSIMLNAINAMPDGGTLSIKLERDERAAMRIIFADTGKGISEKEIHRVFDPFFSDSQGASTGLGLSIAKGIVERHGGKIIIESRRGKGTDVIITCPAGKG